MAEIKQYLISITAAAILCGIVNGFVGKKSALSAIIKLFSGVFLCLTVISPWTKLQLADLEAYTSTISVDASAAVLAGEAAAQAALAESIKSQTEAYILDKAAEWNAELTVEVTVSDTDPPVPCAVRLSGSVSPYEKVQLSQMLEDDLGIAKENQLWTG